MKKTKQCCGACDARSTEAVMGLPELPSDETVSLKARIAALEEALRPFVGVEFGIPENWPEDCVLTFEALTVFDRTREVSYSYLPVMYQGVAPTIADYRAAARALKAPMKGA
jgi:hypothetical protein